MDGEFKRDLLTVSAAGPARRPAAKAGASWMARGPEDGCPGPGIDNRNIKKRIVYGTFYGKSLGFGG